MDGKRISFRVYRKLMNEIPQDENSSFCICETWRKLANSDLRHISVLRKNWNFILRVYVPFPLSFLNGNVVNMIPLCFRVQISVPRASVTFLLTVFNVPVRVNKVSNLFKSVRTEGKIYGYCKIVMTMEQSDHNCNSITLIVIQKNISFIKRKPTRQCLTYQILKYFQVLS